MSSKRRTLKQSWHSNISPQKKKTMTTTTTTTKATSTTMKKSMLLLLTMTASLFLVDLHVQPISAENASDRDDVNNPHAFTFNVAGSSFVSFHPVYSNKQHQRLGLNFRTFQSDSMLLYHTTDNVDPQLHPLLKIYELRAELRQGSLHVHYRLNEFLDNFVIGQNLNDNEWHKLELNMDINTGGFAVSLDFYTSQQGELKAFEPLIRQNALQWEHLPSSIYYGGTDVPQNSEFISFIGCLKDLMYENSDGDYIHVPIETSQNVTEGCHHQCDEEENPCQHNSTCINHYDHVTCECFGTDYEGELCEKEGVTKITLRGYEWLTYQLYIDKLDPAIQIARVSMEFKTERNTGILLYAVGGSPTYSHIIALLNSGFVNVSISSDNVDYDFSISVEMDKDR
uniref:EGF-like domain-containing protein n=2 Tax=Octopus bimaculoides TaxID=37653 RepID=A0A0L8FVR8_OCTBM